MAEMENVCPEPFTEGCTIVDPNGDAQTCPNLRGDGMCLWTITELTEARQYLEDTSDAPEEMRLAGVRAAVEKILEHLENKEEG